jgi:hypothetical protein
LTFLLSEDAALRNLLTGMTVTDQKSDATGTATRTVGVWFGQPDEQIRQQEYPYITIDMVDIAEAFERSMRGKVKPAYYSDPVKAADGTTDYNSDVNNWEIDMPIPVNIDYQVTTYARQPRHDREMLAELTFSRLPLRMGAIELDDNTVRRLDVLDVSKRDISEAGKRLFVNAFTVRISSEIAPAYYSALYKALQVDITGYSDLVEGGTQPLFTAITSTTITD